jgi:cobalamin biosynthesis Mg chelatase CobN
MKTILAALFIFFTASSLAVDIITKDGKSFSDCTVKAVEREGVRIVHRDGTAFLDFDVLPSALQKNYGWTPEKSAARKAAQKAEADAQRIAGENARRAEGERAAAVAKAAEGEKQRVIAARERKDEEQQIAVGNARRAEEERVALSAMAGEQEKHRVRANQVRLAKEKEKESEARAQDEKNTKILKWVGFGFLFVLGSIIAMWIARLPLCRVKSSP